MTDFAKLVLDADTRGLKRGRDELGRTGDQARMTAREVDGSASQMSSAFKRVGVALVAAGLGTVLYDFGKRSVRAAIDAEEMGSAFNVVFGDMAEDVRMWAEETGNALGRSTQEIQRGALAFQELFGKALQPERAAELSKQFAVLTQDLASFKNLSNEVAQQKLFSGLVGEAEPLRAVGVFLNEAAVQAKAAEIGLAGVNGVLTDQEKIVARAAIIQEQLAQASGDVERTGESAANQIKTFNAAVEELQVAIGSKLLPTFTPLVSGAASITTEIAKAAQAFDASGISLSGLMRIVVTAGSAWAAYRLTLLAGTIATSASTAALISQAGAIAGAAGRMGIMTSATAAATVATRTLTAALVANPFGAVAVAVGALSAVFITLGNAQRQARAETDNLISSLRALAQARASDFGVKRAEADLEKQRIENRIAEIRAEQSRVRGSPELAQRGTASSRLRSLENEARDLTWQVIRMEGELNAADRAFQKAEEAAKSMVAPVAQGATAITTLGNAGSGAAGGVGEASRAADELRSVMARAYPEMERYRRMLEDFGVLERSRLSDIEKQRARLALIAANDNSNRDLSFNQGPLEQARKVQEATELLGMTTEELANGAKVQTVQIADSFRDMSQRVIGSLQNLTNSIRSGDLFSTLTGVIDLLIQLGSTGLFGQNIANNINRPVVAGARANGGQVNAGRTYLVGERGPELFTPPGHGRIVSNDNMGGGSVQVEVIPSPYFDARVNGQIVQAAPALASAGAMQASAMQSRAQRRTVRR